MVAASLGDKKEQVMLVRDLPVLHQWRHGGVALGPKPRDYSYSLNKKVKRLAVKSALSAKVLEENLIVVDAIDNERIQNQRYGCNAIRTGC